MLDSAPLQRNLALGKVACCGLSMAIAIGLIAFSSTLVISGLAVAVALGCIAFMLAFGHHRHGHHGAHETAAEHEATPAAR